MGALCFSTNLTSSEWASWVQAIGTIVAVIGAGGIAVWQSRAQHASAETLNKEIRRHAQTVLAKSLLTIARNCLKATSFFAAEMSSRDLIFKIASRERHFDFGELYHLESTTSGIPLYSLPDSLITHAMILAATILQFRNTVDIAVKDHRTMDSDAFAAVFVTLEQMNESLGLTCKDIESAVEEIGKDA